MRFALPLLLLFPSFALAQPTAEQKKATVTWVLAQEDPTGGFYLAPQDPNIDAVPRPSLRATNAALRTLKYLGTEIPNKDKHAAYILKCFDPKTGGFADTPGGKPDVATTSVGVMAAAELSIPHEKFAKAMDYIKESAKSFEDVRIGAAAVEAWGVKDCPFDLKPWFTIGSAQLESWASAAPPIPGKEKESWMPRAIGSLIAFQLRLGEKTSSDNYNLAKSQRSDGGWCKGGEALGAPSDIETTYRVMRALMLLKQPPKDVKKLREFLASHGNKDGGFAVKPGEKSNMSGAYYATIITKWLDDMEKK